jgi:hypothetical protein
VQLFIRYTFLWKNEFHPGKESPSGAFYPTVSGEHSCGRIAAIPIRAVSAVAQAFRWSIRTAVGFYRRVHTGDSTEEVDTVKKVEHRVKEAGESHYMSS